MSLLLTAEKKDSLSRPHSPAPYDLDGALVEATEEIEFDWPELLPVERIKAGIAEIALGFLLFAGLVGLLWLPLNPNPRGHSGKQKCLPAFAPRSGPWLFALQAVDEE